MTSNAITRIPPQQLEADIEAYLALKGLDAYTPHNPRHTLGAVGEALDHLRSLDEAVIHAQNGVAAARDAQQAGQRDFHALILGVKDEVRVLYGSDSDQLAALGLKKKSERKRPLRPRKQSTAA